MKTISLTENDLIELGIIRRSFQLKVEKLRRNADAAARNRGWSETAHTTEEERDAVKSLDVLNRILS